jgi:hypothetical protein
MLRGTWTLADGTKGQWACCREGEDDRAHITGLWVGAAPVDPALKDFCIPTNPVRWALTVFPGPQNPRVAGVG